MSCLLLIFFYWSFFIFFFFPPKLQRIVANDNIKFILGFTLKFIVLQMLNFISGLAFAVIQLKETISIQLTKKGNWVSIEHVLPLLNCHVEWRIFETMLFLFGFIISVNTNYQWISVGTILLSVRSINVLEWHSHWKDVIE